MTRPIDADVLDALIVESYHMTDQEYVRAGYSIVRLLIDKVPTIDAVPVVRCKDCRWGREVCGNIECNFDVPEYHGYDWYCANGDKKNG